MHKLQFQHLRDIDRLYECYEFEVSLPYIIEFQDSCGYSHLECTASLCLKKSKTRQNKQKQLLKI